MKEITIFNPLKGNTVLTKTDRQLLFKNLKVITNLPQYHFEAFDELEDERIKYKKSKSQIPEIVIKNIIMHSQPILKKRTSREFSISTQFNHNIVTIDKDIVNPRVYAKNTQMDIIGIIFDTSRSFIADPHKTSRVSLTNLLMIGNYGLRTITESPISHNFTQALTTQALQKKKIVIFFKNNKINRQATSGLPKHSQARVHALRWDLESNKPTSRLKHEPPKHNQAKVHRSGLESICILHLCKISLINGF